MTGAPAASGASQPRTLDELAARLRMLREVTGSPSYSELADRIAAIRIDRGEPASNSSPGRVTVYDCFRDGRRRIDTSLLLDIVRAMDQDEATVAQWERWSRGIRRGVDAASFVTARTELPPVAEPFVGRAGERTSIIETPSPVLITGMPGSGKTALAVRAAADLLESPNASGVVVLDLAAGLLGAAATPHAIMDAIAAVVGVNIDRHDEQASATTIAEALEEARLVLLIDDITDAGALETLAAAMTSPLIATSRFAQTSAPLRVIELEPWSDDDTLSLITAQVGTDRVASDPASAHAIAAHAFGLPLAATLTASRLALQSGWSLADHRATLDAGVNGIDAGVDAAISASYRLVSPGAQRALRLFASAPTQSLNSHVLSGLWNVTDAQSESLIAELRRAHLVGGNDQQHAALHALVRSFATAKSWVDDPQSARDDALMRAAEAQLSEAFAAAAALHGNRPDRNRYDRTPAAEMTAEQAETWLHDEFGSLLDLVFAAGQRKPQLLIETSEALATEVAYLLGKAAKLDVFERAQAAAVTIGDTEGELRAALEIADVYARDGDPRASKLAADVVNRAREAGLGAVEMAGANFAMMIALDEGIYDEAAVWGDRALALARELNDQRALPIVLDNVATTFVMRGDLPEGIRLVEEAIGYMTEQDDRDALAGTLSNLADMFYLAGDVPRSLETATQAVELAPIGSFAAAYSIVNRARALILSGRFDEGFADLETARAIADSAEDTALQLMIDRLRADATASTDAQGAIELYEAAREKLSGDEWAIATAGLATVLERTGEPARARDLLDQALELLPDVPAHAEVRALRAKLAS